MNKLTNIYETFLQTVTITVEDVDISCLKTTTTVTSNTSSCTSSATNTAAINIISANLRFQSSPSTSSPLTNPISTSIVSNQSANCSYADCLSNAIQIKTDNVWKKRNLENSVIIPQETQVKSNYFRKV